MMFRGELRHRSAEKGKSDEQIRKSGEVIRESGEMWKKFVDPYERVHTRLFKDSWFNADEEEYGGDEFSVRRSFRDVVALPDRLGEVYRVGVVESRVMQKGEFLEQRRVALEKYLRKLENHPSIRRS
ncbi:hypothetical protein LIER_19738 [Lithospermum erythrorhizon]|uniref:PX domain-containing protein n=1 Tax=Lithospermum erythrorhizon TaxID=34254 RepID=A0AAV3QIV0_LITER